MRRAIIAVSFGTTHDDAAQGCILPVEEALRRAFPDWEVHRAWTARFICRKLRERGVSVENETEALARLKAEGVGRIVLASTHIIRGREYGMIQEAAGDLPVSAPLLDDADDLRWMAGLLGGIAREEGRTLLVMGHGTDHAANKTYARLRAELPDCVRLACVEGAYSLDGVMASLEAIPGKRLALMPLMLVAGDHARNDLAGDGEDSWKCRLQARGFDVSVRMQGLGALAAVQRRFAEKVGAVIQ